MEEWSSGKRGTTLLRSSNTPAIHYSITPLLGQGVLIFNRMKRLVTLFGS